MIGLPIISFPKGSVEGVRRCSYSLSVESWLSLVKTLETEVDLPII